jgi:hypothetical protein
MVLRPDGMLIISNILQYPLSTQGIVKPIVMDMCGRVIERNSLQSGKLFSPFPREYEMWCFLQHESGNLYRVLYISDTLHSSTILKIIHDQGIHFDNSIQILE